MTAEVTAGAPKRSSPAPPLENKLSGAGAGAAATETDASPVECFPKDVSVAEGSSRSSTTDCSSVAEDSSALRTGAGLGAPRGTAASESESSSLKLPMSIDDFRANSGLGVTSVEGGSGPTASDSSVASVVSGRVVSPLSFVVDGDVVAIAV